MSLPMKPELQRTFTSAVQFYHRDFEQLRFITYIFCNYPPPLANVQEYVILRVFFPKNLLRLREGDSSFTLA